MATVNPVASDVVADDLDVAPLDWNDYTPEQRDDIEQSLAGIAAGRAKLVPHAEVQRVIAEMRRRQGG